jgi:isoleucyl-tRNA synthetase
MAKRGVIYRGFKSVYWCPDDETALAEAEIEYSDDKCESIYVKFNVTDDRCRLSKYTDLSKTYFVIWTTTTWTLPGNLAICVNADYEYALVKSPSGEVYIVAKELAERVAKAAKLENYEIIATLPGKCCNRNISSEVMTRLPSYPNDGKAIGLLPLAMIMLFASITSVWPPECTSRE